jgi:hypothetical protein
MEASTSCNPKGLSRPVTGLLYFYFNIIYEYVIRDLVGNNNNSIVNFMVYLAKKKVALINNQPDAKFLL